MATAKKSRRKTKPKAKKNVNLSSGYGNREYKDSVFISYLKKPERLIDIYNSITGANLPKDTPIEINSLDGVLYKDRVNDISFIIDGEIIVLMEHQSTLNENMPARLLMYIARLYEKIIKPENIYGSNLIPLPAPKFVVLYNGVDECDEHIEMKLSDAFKNQEKNPMLELKVDFFNINYGKSPELMSKCKSLNEYSTFVYYVREYVAEGYELGKAISLAIEQAIKNDIMKEFLTEHGSEVRNMLFEEWSWEEYARVQREEGLKKGEETGLKRGEENGRIMEQSNLVRKMARTQKPEDIASMTDIPLPTVLKILNLAPAQ